MITKTKIVFFFVITVLLTCSAMKKDIDVPTERALSVKCDMTKINEKTYSFVVSATRLRMDSLEIFRSDEHIKLVITDQKGKIKWHSSNKYAYGAAKSRPMPDSLGATFKYNIEWYGNDDNNNILLTGKYKAQVTIPTVPKPYIIDMEFDWKNPYDR
jgi:hypothetical protein